jgi:competence protein ComEC
VAAGLLAVVGIEWWARSQLVTLAPLARVAALALVVGAAGGARHALYTADAPRALSAIVEAGPDRPVLLTGTVATAPERSGSTTRFALSADSVGATPALPVVEGKARVTLQPSPWNDHTASFPRLHEGDQIQIRGAVRSPPGQRNPGGFDYAAYLARRGICCTVYVDDPAHVTILSRSSSPLTHLVVAARDHVRRQVSRHVPSPDGRAVLNALLLGDRSGITDAQRERFARTGLMHLLAVSGLHVFLVGMVLYVLLRPFLMRLSMPWKTVELTRAGVTILVLLFYMMLTGMRPSVVRAVVMSALLIGALLLQRSAHPLNTLGVAALLLLAIRPPALFDAGFQLSMAAVAGIVTLHPQIVDNLPELWTTTWVRSQLISTVSVSVAATLSTAPVLLYHFGWVSGAGLLLNLLGIPCTALALSAAVALVTVGGIWPTAGAAFGTSADLFVQGLLLASREGAAWLGWAGLRLANPDGWTVGALVAGLFALAQWSRPRHRWRSLICVLALASAGVWTHALSDRAGPTLDILFFDVGQGDAVLVTTPNERRLLVDTGPAEGSSSAAAHSVLPYLKRRGIDHLETVVVTHPDADHLGGLPSILRSVSVGRVVHSGQQADTDLYRTTRHLLQRSRVAQEAVDRGDSLTIGARVHGSVIGPPEDPTRHDIDTENGASVVLRLSYGRVDVLLPGDIEAQAERFLVRTYGPTLASDIVKVPHHGSETSSTKPFVRAVSQNETSLTAVVSVGRFNRFGMPSSDVIARWESKGAKVHSTAGRGAVWLRTDGRTIWRVPWRER